MSNARAGAGRLRTPQRKQQQKETALAAYRVAGTVTHACEAVGINRTTWYRWLDADPAFAERVEAQHQAVADDLEQEAVRRAKDGSDVLLIFLLKGARPEKYRERVSTELTGKGGGPLEVVNAAEVRGRLADRLARFPLGN